MEFYASDVTQITGVKRTRLQQWLERDFVSPSINVANGHGSRNVYSRGDLYTIAIFKKVSEMGLARKVVADMISTLRRYSKAQPILELGGYERLFDLTKYIMYVRFGEGRSSR